MTVLFDDYLGRKEYHWIEKYVKPIEFVGRMARFELTESQFPKKDLTKIVEAFLDPE